MKNTIRLSRFLALLGLATIAATDFSGCGRNPLAKPEAKVDEPIGDPLPPDEGPGEAQHSVLFKYPAEKFKVDILIVSENSASMKKFEENFIKGADSLISALDKYNLDYQIGLIKSNDGDDEEVHFDLFGTNKIVSTKRGNVVKELTQNLMDLKNSYGGNNSEPLWATYEAHLQPENKFLFRAVTPLSVIIVSDSDNRVDDASIVFTYFNGIFNVGWNINGVGTPIDGSKCNGTERDEQPGLRFLETSSGGIRTSICNTNITQRSEDLAYRAFVAATTFPIGYFTDHRVTKIDSIQVNMKDLPVGNWEFNTTSQKIQPILFNQKSFLPKPGDEIFVMYRVQN